MRDFVALQEKCIRKGNSKKPLEERTKSLYVNKNFLRQREEMEQRITSEEGCVLRLNRSIQAEGSFAMTKEDMNFRRFLRTAAAILTAVKMFRSENLSWFFAFLPAPVSKVSRSPQMYRLFWYSFIRRSQSLTVSISRCNTCLRLPFPRTMTKPSSFPSVSGFSATFLHGAFGFCLSSFCEAHFAPPFPPWCVCCHFHP